MLLMQRQQLCQFMWRTGVVCCVLQVILSSEAEKQAAINRANGEAQAITARAQVGIGRGHMGRWHRAAQLITAGSLLAS